MKANRKFVENNDEAVSPVIGVILMVAITVVLAAVVFVLVSDLGGNSSSASAIAFTKDEGADRLKVASADSNADWSSLKVKMSVAGNYSLNAEAALPASLAANTYPTTTVSSTVAAIIGSDYLDFCATGGASNVVVTILDVQANAVVKEITFNSMVACA